MPALIAVNDIYRVRTSTQSIIKRALRLIGVLAAGEPLPADQLADGLEALNDMVDSWNTDNLMVPVLARNTFTLTAATNPHEIAPGIASPGLNAPRPNRLSEGQVFLTGGQLQTTQRELGVLNQAQFERDYDSSLSGTPSAFFYEPTFPTGKLWFNVKPDAGYTLILALEQMLAQVLSDGTTTELALPPGYKEALTFNLAIALAPEYEKEPSLLVIRNATEALTKIQRLNYRPDYLECETAVLRREPYDITSGDLI